VVRFGPQVSWYEADRMAMAFAGPDLPVPRVRDGGSTPARAYAISVRHHGRFLEDTAVEQTDALSPTFTRLLVALHRVPAAPDAPVIWHQTAAPEGSWREFLLAGLVDGTAGGRVAALVATGLLPGLASVFSFAGSLTDDMVSWLSSFLVAVLVWPVSITSWKGRARRTHQA
jgi:hypothetical protein